MRIVKHIIPFGLITLFFGFIFLFDCIIIKSWVHRKMIKYFFYQKENKYEGYKRNAWSKYKKNQVV